MKIDNIFNEKIDCLIEGNDKAKTTIVFVHGFGTDKNENYSLHYDLAKVLAKDFRILRFDFTGCGKSQGKQEDVNLKKQAKDLQVILAWVKKKYKGKIYILAHSMGCFAVSQLYPTNIAKTVFTSIPNAKTSFIIKRWEQNIKTRSGGILNKKGVSLYPRSRNRGIQKLGPSFWQVLKNFDPIKSVANYALKTKLIIFKPLKDKVCGNEYFAPYKKIPYVKYVEISGTHNYQDKKDREKLIRKIKKFFKN